MKQRLTPKRIIEALVRNKGMVSLAARQIGCSRQTIYNYAKEHPDVQLAIEDERELMTDLTELSLYKQIQAGEGWAVQFYLRTQGKTRGYGDEVRHKVGGDADAPPVRHEVKTFGDLLDLARDGDARGGAPDPGAGG